MGGNKDDVLTVHQAGKSLTLIMCLLLLSLTIPPSATAQTESGRIYTIQHSDSLWRLAEKYLGDGHLFPLIIEATTAQAANDPTLSPIQTAELIHPGQRIWIPDSAELSSPKQTTVEMTTTETDGGGVAEQLGGHIAFSFWNDHPDRCTYEINIIEVPACLQGAEQCQASRQIVPLNDISEPALSPAGDRLAFRSWGGPTREDHPFFGCATAHPQRMLGNTTIEGSGFVGTGGFWEDSHPDWSPNGDRIIFDTARNGDGITRIMTINPDGGGETDLRIAGQQPSWAPDNARFVYRGCDLSGNGCGLRIGLAVPAQAWETGHNMLESLVADSQAAHPDWSPVADEVVYQSPQSGSWDLYVVDVDDGEQRQLTSDSGLEGLSAWSPDGQWVAYVASDGVNWSLRLVSRDGLEDHLLFTYDGGFYAIPKVVDPYGVRDWLDEQISWSK